jgi:SAM-dependent methyltransferase
MHTDLKHHWETIYETKQSHEMSWTQDEPTQVLRIIENLNLGKNARIIDVGGGESKLADFLLEHGYTDITVLDISAAAIKRAKQRLGKKADLVKWIVTDILEFEPAEPFDIWHDRAAFHFQVSSDSVSRYMQVARLGLVTGGFAIMGTFSKEGPTQCSGLDIQQYDERSLQQLFESSGFESLDYIKEDHVTPRGKVQHFIYGVFKRTETFS